MDLNLSGNYEGIIVYGKEYGENAGKEVQFYLELEHSKTKITGVSYDVNGFGMNTDPADIKGELKENKISFTKQYRTRHLADKENTVDTSRKGPKILYMGQMGNDKNEFNGEWRMSVAKKFFGLIPLNEKSTGTWSMKKITNDNN